MEGWREEKAGLTPNVKIQSNAEYSNTVSGGTEITCNLL